MQERLEYCKVCENRKFRMEQGIICGLTMEKPTFEDECPTYEHDEVEHQKLIKKAELSFEREFAERTGGSGRRSSKDSLPTSGSGTATGAGFRILGVLTILGSLVAIGYRISDNSYDASSFIRVIRPIIGLGIGVALYMRGEAQKKEMEKLKEKR
ncbi:hypothetical protein [Phaeocystidibacter luteus]|uniref:Uncharacterized protein n=1 Tax=Phaeocystidibacter luteus TaxID=911197 RepID=A0A6N6RFM9_9FLAO|nr:hypothetical protein [Phaeocystidibacter luteus]KAB2807345.1 hypothetical protein F8C67_12260 [Phaeocystidibacter luteus]